MFKYLYKRYYNMTKKDKKIIKDKDLNRMVGVQLPQDHIDQLRILAEKEDRSLSGLIRRIIKDYLPDK